MRTGQVIKSAASAETIDELELVNSYSRRELTAEDVYLFSVVLCDNEIDRDYEMFSKESLQRLSELFVGKTGIIDHNASAKNQKARIISCKTEKVSGRKTSSGEDYVRLVARAYILRNDENLPLIDLIDAGIVKEVSVGCSVERTVCSVCHEEMNSPLCSHRKGRTYQGELCCGVLTDPVDAYEFSFVAVPAQRGAGVIKTYQNRKESTMREILKKLDEEKEATFFSSELSQLKAYISELEKSSEDAKAYREQLKKEMYQKFSDSFSSLSAECAKSVIDKLTASEMRELCSSFKAQKASSAKPQLYREPEKTSSGKITQFTI